MSSRREFFKKGILAGAGFALLNTSVAGNDRPETGVPEDNMFTLPPLPYATDSLEPFIDKQTMELHHGKHHRTYVDKLNKALQDAKLSGISLDDLCKNISNHSSAIRNNAGGHYNHSVFWKGMKPKVSTVLSPASANEPTGKLGEFIKSTFDSFDNFKSKFAEASVKVFGSGWTWLVLNSDRKLVIGSTPNQDNPIMNVSDFTGIPVLALDVWEHAYYLKYQNKRADYVSAWWNVVNWEEAGRRFEGK